MKVTNTVHEPILLCLCFLTYKQNYSEKCLSFKSCFLDVSLTLFFNTLGNLLLE